MVHRRNATLQGEFMTDRDLNYRDEGGGAPALLFVHGYGCAHDDWDRQVAALSGEFRCVAPDLPGHGASQPPEEVTLASLAEAVTRLRRRLGLGDVILIGHSMGAKVVREAYDAEPDGVRGIVLIEGSLYVGARDELVGRAREMVDRDGFAAFAEKLFSEMFVASSDAEAARRLVARARGFDPAFGRALFLHTVGWDPLRGAETLERIAVPLLLLQSTYFDADFIRRPIPPGGSARFIETVKSLVPSVETEIVPNAGHFPMFDAPEAISDRLRIFARRIAESTSEPERS